METIQAENLIVIMSDEHDPRHLGASGSNVVQTPSLDRLAENGTRFTQAYTTSPICVPARASFATGRYVHDIGYWDNAMGYDGRVPGWGHRLQRAGCPVEAIGKLHYRSEADPVGFDRQINAMHLHEGVGQVWGSVRDPLPEARSPRMFHQIGPGVSNYNLFDRRSADEACNWLRNRSKAPDNDRPWMLYVGLAAPHFPLVVPREYLNRYPDECVPPRKLHPRDGYTQHPWIRCQERFMSQEELFADEAERRLGVRAYFGLCSFMDAQVGLILDALEDCGLSDSTRVIYTSDHGDNLGARGLWGKCNLYEENVKIPMIVSGPGIPRKHVCRTPASLIDLHPTILQGLGLSPGVDAGELPGRSLFDMIFGPDDSERVVLSEYHAVGAASGAFMLRKGRYKLNYYVGMESELFDLQSDPEETADIARDKDCRDTLKQMQGELRKILDPEAVDARAKADQAALVERSGGREQAFRIGAKGATPVPGLSDE